MANKKAIKAWAFATPCFNHKGVDHNAKELEARVKDALSQPETDEEAQEVLALFAELQKLGHVVEAGTEVQPAGDAANDAARLRYELEQKDAELAELKKKLGEKS